MPPLPLVALANTQPRGGLPFLPLRREIVQAPACSLRCGVAIIK